jgi:hypothetical protein
MKYTHEQWAFLYETYVKSKSYKSWKSFTVSILVGVPALSGISELVKKVHSAGSFLDKKCSRSNDVLTKEKLHEIGARLEHSPCISLI